MRNDDCALSSPSPSFPPCPKSYVSEFVGSHESKKKCGFRLYSGRPCSGDPWRPAVSHSGSPCSPCSGDPRWPASSAPPWLRPPCSDDPRRPATPAPPAPSSAPAPAAGRPCSDNPCTRMGGWRCLGARRPDCSTTHGPAPRGELVPRPPAQPLAAQITPCSRRWRGSVR